MAASGLPSAERGQTYDISVRFERSREATSAVQAFLDKLETNGGCY
jgi:hypothetical protein